MQGKDVMTVAEAAKELNVTESLVRRWIRDKQLPATKFGDRAWLVKPASVRAFKRIQRKRGVRTQVSKKDFERLA